MFQETSLTEQNILTKLDQLIEIILAIEQGKKEAQEAQILITELNSLLEQLFGSQTLPLQQIYSQLITQRLRTTEKSKTILDTLLTIANLNSPPKNKTDLARIIATFYPQEKIVKNFTLRSFKFAYYLPGKKLVFLLSPHDFSSPPSLKLILKQNNLQLITITPRERAQPKEFYQKMLKFNHSQTISIRSPCCKG